MHIIHCGKNDDPYVNVDNATSEVDEDTERISEGWTYEEKMGIDQDALYEQEQKQQNAKNHDDDDEETSELDDSALVDKSDPAEYDDQQISDTGKEIVCATEDEPYDDEGEANDQVDEEAWAELG